MFSNIILKAIQFFLLPLYTQFLSPEELGISDSITSFTSFLFPLLVMAFDSAFSAFYYEEGQCQSEKVFNTTFSFLLLQSISPILLSFASDFISEVLFGTVKYSFGVKLALFAVSINLLYLPFALLTRMQNRMQTFAIINVTASLLMICSNILFVSVFKWGYASMLMSTLLVNILQMLLYLLTCRIRIAKCYFDKQLFNKMIYYAMPLIPMAVSTWVLNLSDRYMLLYFSGEAEVGIYGIGGRFLTIINVVISGITTAYSAFAFKSFKEENAQEMFADTVNIIFVFLVGICTTISLFGKEAILLMTTKEYHTAYSFLPELMFSQLAYALYTFIGYGISFRKKSKYFFYSVTSGAVVNVILNLVILPELGAKGAALTTLIGMICILLVSYHFSQKLYPCDYGMTKIGIFFLGLYFLSTLCKDLAVTVKVVIWVSVATITIFCYRKRLNTVLRAFLIK